MYALNTKEKSWRSKSKDAKRASGFKILRTSMELIKNYYWHFFDILFEILIIIRRFIYKINTKLIYLFWGKDEKNI